MYLQGRRADLELQHKQGKDDPEELHYKQHCAWLWWEPVVTVDPHAHTAVQSISRSTDMYKIFTAAPSLKVINILVIS